MERWFIIKSETEPVDNELIAKEALKLMSPEQLDRAHRAKSVRYDLMTGEFKFEDRE